MYISKALAIIIRAKLSRSQYNVIRLGAKKIGKDIYPSYGKKFSEKKKCYPMESTISITEKSAEVQLQAILNHTSERILAVQKEVISNYSTKNKIPSGGQLHITMYRKYGADGTSNQANYKQTFFSDGGIYNT
jgi:hypothetical protein